MGGTSEFISVKGRIKGLIKNNPNDIFDFVVDEDGRKSSKTFGPDNINPDLVGWEVPIIDGTSYARFNEDGTIDVIESKNESLPQENTVKQLKKLRKLTKGVDIGDRISDMTKQGANVAYIENPIDTGIESYQDFEKKNKSFIPSWNLRHLVSPFRKSKKTK